MYSSCAKATTTLRFFGANDGREQKWCRVISSYATWKDPRFKFNQIEFSKRSYTSKATKSVGEWWKSHFSAFFSCKFNLEGKCDDGKFKAMRLNYNVGRVSCRDDIVWLNFVFAARDEERNEEVEQLKLSIWLPAIIPLESVSQNPKNHRILSTSVLSRLENFSLQFSFFGIFHCARPDCESIIQAAHELCRFFHHFNFIPHEAHENESRGVNEALQVEDTLSQKCHSSCV